MCKEAVSRARNMHGRWDRTRREWEGLLTRSEGHPNTVGCKFEVDLRHLVAVLVGVDEKMMVVEKAQLSNTPLDDVAIRESGEHATRLNYAIKDGEQEEERARDVDEGAVLTKSECAISRTPRW